MKPKYFFESDKISYSDFLKTIEVMLENRIFFCEKECIERGIDALDKLDEKTQTKLIKTAIEIDRDFSASGVCDRSCSHKLPIILKSADLLLNFSDKVENLTSKELILISYYYSNCQIPFDKKRFDFFLDKELLKGIQNKTTSYSIQFDMLSTVDVKLEDLGVDNMNEEQYKATKLDMINKINNSSMEDILNMANVRQRATEEIKKANM